jgi:hypothetical protein
MVGMLREVSRQEYLKKREEAKLEELRDELEDAKWVAGRGGGRGGGGEGEGREEQGRGGGRGEGRGRRRGQGKGGRTQHATQGKREPETGGGGGLA